jgi:tetratricopeptide (TPR) repeat protein
MREIVVALGVPSRTLYGLIKSGFVTPARGPRRQFRFSFQDILVLKTAHGLMAGAVPRRKITRAVRALRRQLPAHMPLAGLRIQAVGDRVVVQEKSHAWEPETGQGVLTFEVVPDANRLRLIESREETASPASIDEWFAVALALEGEDPEGACERYREIIAMDASYVDAYINCGRLLHEANELADAERLYRAACEACEACASLSFNLAVLLEDAGRVDEAIAAYQQALQCDPDHRDSHYNLARLFEANDRPQHAIRHFNQYRTLAKSTAK